MDKCDSAPNLFGKSLGDHDDNSSRMTDYMFNRNLQQQKQSMLQQQPHQQKPFADFGPNLAYVQETGIDPVYFLKFPFLNKRIEDHIQTQHLVSSHRTPQEGSDCGGNIGSINVLEDDDKNYMQFSFVGGREKDRENNNGTTMEVKRKRKRARTRKTIEEVENQRTNHIMAERNRRKQMNEHLRVLGSLMPSSYVKRGDQASIIGGVIEFVIELEQLQQCLESQKRWRILEETGHRQRWDMTRPTNPSSSPVTRVANQNQPLIITENVTELEGGGGLLVEMAENKSCFADVEVKLQGFDAMIKILSRRRPGQLLMTMAALEDLHFSILHTNITTMEQTVLYSFIVKITSETKFTAEEIASSIQQIFSFIHEM